MSYELVALHEFTNPVDKKVVKVCEIIDDKKAVEMILAGPLKVLVIKIPAGSLKTHQEPEKTAKSDEVSKSQDESTSAPQVQEKTGQADKITADKKKN